MVLILARYARPAAAKMFIAKDLWTKGTETSIFVFKSLMLKHDCSLFITFELISCMSAAGCKPFFYLFYADKTLWNIFCLQIWLGKLVQLVFLPWYLSSSEIYLFVKIFDAILINNHRKACAFWDDWYSGFMR